MTGQHSFNPSWVASIHTTPLWSLPARQQVCLRYPYLFIILVMLLPIVGPLLDHHYGERYVYHDHIHIGPAHIEAHSHAQAEHHHDNVRNNMFLLANVGSVFSDDSLLLHGGSAYVLLLNAWGSLLPSLPHFYHRLFPETPQLLEEIYFLPPDRPPRR